jgi:hypothetical protein
MFANHVVFLEDYNIKNQFQVFANENESIDILDFYNVFNMYFIEASLFIDEKATAKFFDVSSCGVYPIPLPLPPSGFDFKSIDLNNLPKLPEEYFITGTINLGNWIGSPYFKDMQEAIIFLYTLPDWLYPCQIVSSSNKNVYE